MDFGILNSVQSAIILFLDIYVLLKAIKGRKEDIKSKYFSLLALSASIEQFMSFLVRIIKTKLVPCSLTLQYLIYIVMFIFMALTAWGAMHYLLHIRRKTEKIAPVVNTIMKIPCIVMAVTAISSPWTGWLFYLDDSLNYHRGSLFFLQMLCPYIFAIVATIMMVIMLVRHENEDDKNAVRYFLCFIVPVIIGAVLQVAFNVDGGYSSIGISVSVILLYMEFYVEEIRELEHLKGVEATNIMLQGQLQKIEQLNCQLEQNQAQLEEAVLEAKKANEAKSRFLSRMSHDIRTPLNGIIGLIELADRHPGDINVFLEGKEKARVASQHLLSLVNDVLELSKLDDDDVTLAHEPFDILKLSADVLTIAGTSAAEYGVTMIHENCSQEFKYPYVYGSPLHVRQILLNIINNAAKYNHPGGDIYCRARMSDKVDMTVTYTVEIEDTGIGMSPEFIDHLFEPFTQEHYDARSTFRGTGLGMAIVKSLLDRMKGTITVESQVEKGSKFTVSIPFEIADESDMPKVADTDEKDITGMKLLLVEDNELNMEIARAILEDFGAIITEAENGQQAVDIFEQNAPATFDAILMDVMMPVLDGYSATRKIRAMSREDAKKIPIIAMTANAFEEDRQNALQAGMNGYIAKPIDVKEMMKVLAGILN